MNPPKEGVPCVRYPDEPEGYIAWAEWAEKKGKKHFQELCIEHGLYHVWTARRNALKAGRGKKKKRNEKAAVV